MVPGTMPVESDSDANTLGLAAAGSAEQMAYLPTSRP